MQYVKCLVILMDQLIPHECFLLNLYYFLEVLMILLKQYHKWINTEFNSLVSIPVPVLLILGLMAKSITLFTGTKILNLEDILMWLGWVGLGWVGLC